VFDLRLVGDTPTPSYGALIASQDKEIRRLPIISLPFAADLTVWQPMWFLMFKAS
jgi:hypothetical protein